MSPEDSEVYVMREDDDEEWVSPTPIGAAVVDRVTALTDLEEADLDDLDSYVDPEELRTLLSTDGEGTVSFEMEGHEVTVDADGGIDVSD